jgi:hypothetical protein
MCNLLWQKSETASSEDWLHSLQGRKCESVSAPTLWGFVMLLYTTHVRKCPGRINYMNWQLHVNSTCWEQIQQMVTRGHCLRFSYTKHIKRVKNLFHCKLFVFLKREIFLCGKRNKLAKCMLIIWENFGPIPSWRLLRKIFLTGDIFSEFHGV